MKKKIAVCMAGILAVSVLMSCGSQVGERGAESITDVTNENADAPDQVDAGAETEAEDSDDAEASEGDAQDAEAENDEEEVVILKDGVEKQLGCFVGTAITSQELGDTKIWALITTHFNAITLGNELKPDCMFGYSNGRCKGTEEADLNGETIVVPKLDYSKSEKILDRIVKWNNENPDNVIKVRGHVLVWHAQTPEWFFHEDYDKTKDYVDTETMNKRLEWYIKTMLTHYTGEDSKYKDLFYGWDVVNEAVSDATGTYRSDSENSEEPLTNDTHNNNSSWWHVYQSNEYIINAFTYANKYAPADLELYYNDYNECMLNKQKGIIELLKAVKEKEGAPGEGTRIDAMGMQGHYQMSSPSMVDFENAIRAYAAVIGNVQITEMDMKSSDNYDGSAEAKEREFTRQAERYNTLYWVMKTLNQEDDINITGLTFWGTVDHYSWLQSRSDVGGGNKEGLPECPLLFDEMYLPKPAFYVFAGE
ncbi:MAG: endo-1,4-beta-xylanase [Lachnospiraceae bacterium]|nr:endo-1,4-beta-xylanase [Lachnospiraceae bacterium]